LPLAFYEPAEAIGDSLLAGVAAVQVDQCGPRAAMTHPVHQLTQRGSGYRTGRERFTNHAEWVSVTADGWWHLPSSLRFFVAFAASSWPLMQRDWMQHPGI
jgi:hypothetical protein